MDDVYRSAADAAHDAQQAWQQQREEMVRERQQQFEISQEFAEYLVNLELRIRALESRG
jgi:hypothetical protein